MEQALEVGVVGAGQMGCGIAQVAAAAGCRVRLCDARPGAAAQGVARIRAALARLVEKGQLTPEAMAATSAGLTAVAGLAELASASVVIEAVSEDRAAKGTVFRELDRLVQPAAILASNTSSIPITELAAQTTRPGQVIGMHFMNPVPRMRLVEVVRGLATSDATWTAVVALAERFGKQVVTSQDRPGFIVNRLLIPFLNEACFALQESLGSLEDIDAGIRLGLNHPLGPFQLMDLIGLDTCLAIAEVLHRDLGEDKYRPAPLLRQYVAAGRLGRKCGRGFYAYETP